MPDISKPIGIFDSGVGGLTILKSLTRILPDERFVYFGDTEHLPYGDKSPQAIRYYSKKISEFLIQEHRVKAIVIACNTASAQAYHSVKRYIGKDFPIINVISPVVKYVAQKYADNIIGIIGTKGTIKSEVYDRAIKRLAPKAKICSKATPLLAPIIEEGFANSAISEEVIKVYLSDKKLLDIDTLIPACTHYPIIIKELNRFYSGKIEVVNTPDIVAEYVKNALLKHELLSATGIQKQANKFIVSDYSRLFSETATRFFQHKIRLSEHSIW